MIPVMSSQELNKIFKESQTEAKAIDAQIQAIKKDISKKLSIIKYENEFISRKLDAINTGLFYDETLVAFDHNRAGLFDDYGYMVHPKFKKAPIDIFNLKLLTGDSMFKNSMISKVNGVEDMSYNNLLMADNVRQKEIIFEELKTDSVKLEYELDNTVALGTARFNMIEIDPYIYGAYDLISIEIYSLDATGKVNAEPTKVLNGFENMGRTRIILEEKVRFTKVIFNFKNNFKSEANGIAIYPFGLKHIHFFEVDFLPESFIIAEISSDKFIEYINDDIKLYTTNGAVEANMNEFNLEVYTDYDYNTLTGRVYPSSDAGVNRIAKNTKKLYVKVPLVKKNIVDNTKQYLGLNGIKFNYSSSEEIIF
jgi:hypothetical protein